MEENEKSGDIEAMFSKIWPSSMRQQLLSMLESQAKDDTWYELYKSITNEKDMAERDQQKLVRREKRKKKEKKELRERRLKLIAESLKIRANKRKRLNLKMTSTSVDRYEEGNDHEYEQ